MQVITECQLALVLLINLVHVIHVSCDTSTRPDQSWPDGEGSATQPSNEEQSTEEHPTTDLTPQLSGSDRITPTSDLPTCSDGVSVSVTVLPWPPYAGNSSDTWQTEMINVLREVLSKEMNVSFNKTSNIDELKKLIDANKTHIGLPLIINTSDTHALGNICLEPHPGLEYLVAPEIESPSSVCIKTLLASWPLLALSLILTGIAGMIIWLLEVLSNPEEFPNTFASGSWEGFWWAFISMTTVGYGDKCPRSIAGRCFAVLWIFASLILVAVFMANVTTALTSNSVKPEYKITDTEVGVVKASLEETVAKNDNAEVKVFKNYDQLMKAFLQKNVSAILIDHLRAGFYLKNATVSFRSKIFHKYLPQYKYMMAASISKSFQWYIDCCNDTFINHAWDEVQKNMSNFCYQETEVFNGITTTSRAAAQSSFNLFVDSKVVLQNLTYICLGVLVVLIIVGFIVDKLYRKTKMQKTGVHEMKSLQDYAVMQDIAEGKDMLIKLQLFLEKMEENIKKNSTNENNTGSFKIYEQ